MVSTNSGIEMGNKSLSAPIKWAYTRENGPSGMKMASLW